MLEVNLEKDENLELFHQEIQSKSQYVDLEHQRSILQLKGRIEELEVDLQNKQVLLSNNF